MSAGKIKDVPLEIDAWLGDTDFILMTDNERGIYWTLCLYLYANGGKMRLDVDKFIRLCNCNSKNERPEVAIQSVLRKFQVRRGFIYHKKVTKQLRIAQARIDSAVKAANARWQPQRDGNAFALLKQCHLFTYLFINNNYTYKEALDKARQLVRDSACLVGISEDKADGFFDHYNAQGWVLGNGQTMTDLQSALVRWRNNGYKFEKKTKKSAAELMEEYTDA
jgi:uncharacterized protein YdaU (DUF1376 family)